ncbi:MAG TPA: DNA-directed RNA polymerase subunit alpha C-terminal domain-containing protein [Thermoguttaceae bacterium]|nr:DNA-directed RNA polymerase subunit alpha C-terminal domain-containing protein [Thermoguttaceae bacterium]
MAQGLQVDLKQMVLFNGSFGPREIEQMADAMAGDYASYRTLRGAVAELEEKEDQSPASNVRLGVCLYLLGRYERAVDCLRRGDGGALAHFYMARAFFALRRYDAAVDSYGAASRAGYNGDDCTLGRVEALRQAGDATAALAALDELSGAVEQTAEYLYQRGATVATLGGNPTEVVALYQRAVETDRGHSGALFGLALENDRRGNDEQALELYQRSVARFPPHVGSLLNLGLLYEDLERYERAIECYLRILDVYPSHPRARLYMKDAQASGDMYYDEDAQKRRDRMTQILGIPVTDFELSVRSRNCLQKMGITTLGDLCRCTEQELLASKNFGETSLIEIKEMLGSRGLRLGQLAPERHALEMFEPESLSPDEQELLSKPMTELNLSVRARKCMIRLGITTISELIRRTGDELLECKNFGVTSLNEVRDKLSVHSLKLRGD